LSFRGPAEGVSQSKYPGKYRQFPERGAEKKAA
jgi:hypothetical protein